MSEHAPARPGEPATVHRYPVKVIRGAYLRAGIGAAAAGGLALASPGSAALSVIWVTLVAIFLAYGARTYLRGASTVIADQGGLRVAGPRPLVLSWKELTGLRLGYYTTRRDGENGWMELSVRGREGRITLDSDIDGFADIAARSLAAAEASGVALSPATLRNFDVLRRGSRSARQRP